MFGTLRFALAIMVVLAHTQHYGPIGSLAVKGFFVLSGFLMTMLMDTVYKDRIGDFVLNRFLRLFPTYWACMLISALIYFFVPGSSAYFGLSNNYYFVMQLLYINPHWIYPSLLPTAWAVTNEMVMYALIALGLSRTLGITAFCLIFSQLYVASVADFAPGNAGWSYFYPTAASLPFATGAMAYHLQSRVEVRSRSLLIWMGLIGLTLAVYLSRNYSRISLELFTLSTALLVSGLLCIESSQIVKAWDERVGKLSYPLYLIHLPILYTVFFKFPSTRAWVLDLLVVLLAVAMSILIVIAVDNPIQLVRRRVRDRAMGTR